MLKRISTSVYLLRNLYLLEWFAIMGWFCVLTIIMVRSATQPEKHTVLPVYCRAAMNWLGGRLLYAGQVDFRYSPPVAASFVPLVFLSDSVRAVVWRLIDASALLVALGYFVKLFLPGNGGRDRRALVFLLVLPLWGSIHRRYTLAPLSCNWSITPRLAMGSGAPR